MTSATKLKKLEGLYHIHEQCVKEFNSACGPCCSSCCTRNVTVTSLETAFFLNGLSDKKKKDVHDLFQKYKEKDRLIPLSTVNSMADICINGGELPEEISDPSWTPCPLLSEENLCTVYDLRPFACRAMSSSVQCSSHGEAEMDEYIFTLNNVFMQIIEHTDQGGSFANFIDQVLCFSEPENLDSYLEQGIHINPPEIFLINRPVSVLMVPPEHRDKIRKVLDLCQAL